MEFLLGVLALIGLVIYLKLYEKKKSWHLDKNGVIQESSIETSSFIKIKKEDFEWMYNIFKNHFPNGYINLDQHGYGVKNILIVTTSLYHHQYTIKVKDSDDYALNGWADVMESILYVQKANSDNLYYLYLRRPCTIGMGPDEIVFKGRVVQGTIEDLKHGFDEWLQDQKAFANKYQDRINALKNEINQKQKEYDSQEYEPPKF
ncbi:MULTISPECIES: hypothetical protein [Acinetobacter]|uniref:hypothetical protein n=1 Tax=Acinetobacter TaxID=469 RepID=UPI0015D268BB|nr:MULTISPECIES: hypothetical protein [Acinetobacter]MDM1272078.1 hypothetical protein [Acinetobacter indicus]QOW52665.1 hypothetical protein G0030_05460 [Acinetobacter indicus]